MLDDQRGRPARCVGSRTHAARDGAAQALLELRAQLGIPLSVYLLVTKADLLAASPSISATTAARNAQGVGFTFPLAQSEAPGFDLRAAFDREYRLRSG